MSDRLEWTDTARETIRSVAEHRLAWNTPVAIACSGGVDSTALLLLAAAARESVAPFVAVNVNHGTRPETVEEARQVARLCAALDVPFIEVKVDADWDEGEHVAEHRLRAARYDALARIVSSLHLNAVVTAHTQDDQVETILLRLFAGVGPAGVAGMLPSATIATAHGDLRILRPFLDVPRTELHRLVRAVDLDPVDDPSNADMRYKRNALRHAIIPQLRSMFPGFPSTLLRTVALIRDDADVIDGLTHDIIDQAMEASEAGVAVNRSVLRSVSRPLASRIVRYAAREASSAPVDTDWRELNVERVDAVLNAAAGRTGTRIELPHGVDVHIERNRLVFVQRRDKGDDDR